MQVLPRFVSVDEDNNEFEFLLDFFSDPYEALSQVFLKGYQWPFDSKKVISGSSVIDLLVYRECVLKGRRVYLDFTKNPFGLEKIDFLKLSDEAYNYLSNAEACFGTPIERLAKMNQPGIDLYLEKGLDITEKYLEIALCAQHNNGGIAVNLWWQTNIKGLFAAGECAGTHGVTRPGGSALNAGQVGSLRAAQYISAYPNTDVSDDTFYAVLSKMEKELICEINLVLKNPDNIDKITKEASRRMSDTAAAIRNRDKMEKVLRISETLYKSLSETVGLKGKKELYRYFKLKDILITQCAVLSAMIDYSKEIVNTRGSALYYDQNGKLREGLEEIFRFTEENGSSNNKIQEIQLKNNKFNPRWRNVRPIPENHDFFENVWRSFRKNKNIY